MFRDLPALRRGEFRAAAIDEAFVLRRRHRDSDFISLLRADIMRESIGWRQALADRRRGGGVPKERPSRYAPRLDNDRSAVSFVAALNQKGSRPFGKEEIQIENLEADDHSSTDIRGLATDLVEQQES